MYYTTTDNTVIRDHYFFRIMTLQSQPIFFVSVHSRKGSDNVVNKTLQICYQNDLKNEVVIATFFQRYINVVFFLAIAWSNFLKHHSSWFSGGLFNEKRRGIRTMLIPLVVYFSLLEGSLNKIDTSFMYQMLAPGC